jgi:hypothetical protein
LRPCWPRWVQVFDDLELRPCHSWCLRPFCSFRRQFGIGPTHEDGKASD